MIYLDSINEIFMADWNVLQERFGESFVNKGLGEGRQKS